MNETIVNEVLDTLAKSKNVLLYGPPGTGKTWLLSQIIERLKSHNLNTKTAQLDKNQKKRVRPAANLGEENAFVLAPDKNATMLKETTSNYISNEAQYKKTLPESLSIEWLTFHQSYSYEDFIIGKKPKPKDGGIVLEPHFGTLMSLAVSLDYNDNINGCLIIIDEINRANASQVFGEFITLLDPNYRRTVHNVKNELALPIKFPGIEYDAEGQSEFIKMLHGGINLQLPDSWTFPEHVYILATMNSVDKAALPLDSALTRRFHRIEMKPDINLLAQSLSVDIKELTAKVNKIKSDTSLIESLTSEETTVLLLDKLNFYIASDIGPDFELGHALVWSVVESKEESRWSALISAWDNMLYPQLIDRFSSRTDILKNILKISPESATIDAFTERSPISPIQSIDNEDAPISFKLLKSLDEQKAIKVLKNLAL